MKPESFLGIDGGGTHTRAFVTDASGERTGWGEAGLSNPNHASEKERKANLEQAIHLAYSVAGLDLSGCASVFAGMAGITTEAGKAQLQGTLQECGLKQALISVDHDIRIALAGGLCGRPGIALIVGTGSSCYGRAADGRSWQTGGWEALISDEGSAFYVAREAMAAAVRMADGRSEESELRPAVFRWLGIGAVPEILPRIHERGLTRSEIAAFAPEVITLASKGDVAALGILDCGAALLAEMAAANHRMLPTGPGPDLVITGGLGTASTLYRAKIEGSIRAALPSVKIEQPLFPPAMGATMLAMQQAGSEPSEEVFERWKRLDPS